MPIQFPNLGYDQSHRWRDLPYDQRMALITKWSQFRLRQCGVLIK